MGNGTGALLPKAPSASVVPALRLRAAVPIWTNPTVSGSLGGLPLTDTRMPALEPRGTSGDVGGRLACAHGDMIVSSSPLSQVYSRHSRSHLVHSAPVELVSGGRIICSMIQPIGFVNYLKMLRASIALNLLRASFQSSPTKPGTETLTSRLNCTTTR